MNDDSYLDEDFLKKVAGRGSEIISIMGKSSAASAAKGACDHMRYWWNGTPEGDFTSMAVIPET